MVSQNVEDYFLIIKKTYTNSLYIYYIYTWPFCYSLLQNPICSQWFSFSIHDYFRLLVVMVYGCVCVNNVLMLMRLCSRFCWWSLTNNTMNRTHSLIRLSATIVVRILRLIIPLMALLAFKCNYLQIHLQVHE